MQKSVSEHHVFNDHFHLFSLYMLETDLSQE